MYQDVTISVAGKVDYSFAHRGRSGEDTLAVTITYFGPNGIFEDGGGDDVIEVDGVEYMTDNDAWVHYKVQDAFDSVAGGKYRFAYGAVSTAGGNPSAGNFIDAVSFGVDAAPIPEPSSLLLSAAGAGLLLMRRKRS